MHSVSRRIPRRLSRASFLLLLAIGGVSAPMTVESQAPETVVFTGGGGRGNISSSVSIPAGAALIWTSGTVPSIADQSAAAGTRARYGDTKTQAISVLRNIENVLKEKGLTMKDVVYLRAYLVPDKEKGGTIDTQGWNEAYGMFFNNAENPVKVARSTVGVMALVNADWLVEVEAFAVYPKK